METIDKEKGTGEQGRRGRQRPRAPAGPFYLTPMLVENERLLHAGHCASGGVGTSEWHPASRQVTAHTYAGPAAELQPFSLQPAGGAGGKGW